MPRKMTYIPVVVVTVLLVLLTACDQDLAVETNQPVIQSLAGSRWYSEEQVQAGSKVFADNCASCHGFNAEGLYSDWKVRLADGSFPPPPLNGGAHAWHHPLTVLLGVISDGGVALGGKMPGFRDSLSDDQKLSAIAYFQDFWSDETYENWLQMGGTN